MAEFAPRSARNERERRRSMRAPTRRDALLFLPEDGNAPIRGRVSDIGPGGLRILTDQPVQPGVRAEIELAPPGRRPTGQPVLVRGQVRWCSHSGRQQHAAGICFHMQWPAPRPVPRLTEPGEARDLIAALRGDLRARPDGVPSPLAFVELRRTDSARRPRHRGKWSLLLLLVLMLAAAFWETLRMPKPNGQHHARGAAPGNAAENHPPPIPAQEAAVAVPGPALFQLAPLPRNIGAPATSIGIEPPPGKRASTPGTGDDPETARGRVSPQDSAFKSVPEERPDSRVWTAPPEPAQRMAAVSPRPVEHPDRLGEASLASTVATALPGNFAGAIYFDGESLWPFDPALALAHPTRIEIRLGEHALTLFEGGLPGPRYRIGAGANDATPRGAFVIANKIEHPDWHHRGETVPADDPRNPLGDFWLGLGQGGAPLPYGIHPTSDDASIGANQSAGCIRMRPGDARDLFHRVNTGVPVFICD